MQLNFVYLKKRNLQFLMAPCTVWVRKYEPNVWNVLSFHLYCSIIEIVFRTIVFRTLPFWFFRFIFCANFLLTNWPLYRPILVVSEIPAQWEFLKNNSLIILAIDTLFDFTWNMLRLFLAKISAVFSLHSDQVNLRPAENWKTSYSFP